MCSGFSLAEFLVVIALLGIAISLAVPGLRHLHTSRLLTTHINDLVHAVHLARQLSLTTGNAVSLCPSDDSDQCNYAANWQDGWLLFRHSAGGSRPQVAGAGDILLNQSAMKGLQVTANRPAFTLRSYGQRSTNGTFVFCDPRGRTSGRRLIISFTGKPRVERLARGSNLCGRA